MVHSFFVGTLSSEGEPQGSKIASSFSQPLLQGSYHEGVKPSKRF